ncbi:DUF2280 domain-containing protein [Solimonas marina]|uniref:DUF2280 domain-containing protein n=1 Tax=Solimonas marina TaxID=2714601 RepID=A0A969W8Q5_9GAMM|nr:DUF2280 domain-containing protein [Solimonas marina]NKF21589.1 DUF2280 domain-containing protein [Solimonas marina]
MAKSKLPDEVKAFIVQGLACYDAPSVVAEAVKQEFGIVVTRQSVEQYDPNKRAGKNLSEKWRVLFDATRKEFKTKTNDIPIANKAVRLRTLQRMVDKAESMKNLPLAAQLLKQAAEEVGDVYTNRQKVDANVKSTARTVIVPAKDAK